MSKTIEEAAREYAEIVTDNNISENYGTMLMRRRVQRFDSYAIEEAYLDGAYHVLSPHLSERLTEEEKMMIRNEYERTYPDDIDCGIENIMVRAALERIFGKEMFEKEGE